MFSGGLSPTLIDALMDVTTHVPELLEDVQRRLLDSIGGILSRDVKGRVGPGVNAAHTGAKAKAVVVAGGPGATAPSTLRPPLLILALKTLSTFNFVHQDVHLLALIRDVVLLYLSVDSPLIRREAAVTIARTLSRLGSHTRGGKKGELVYFLLKRLVIVAIADPIPVIRLTVLSSLHPSLDHFLSQAELLHSLFVALNDEIFTIRELTITLLGRLSSRNPSLIMPTLRKTLIQLLTSLQQMHTDAIEQEESSKLLSHLITSSHHLIRPYVSPILHVLVPKLTDMTSDSKHSGVGSYVLSTLGDLSTICGDDLLPYLDGLLSPHHLHAAGQDQPHPPAGGAAHPRAAAVQHRRAVAHAQVPAAHAHSAAPAQGGAPGRRAPRGAQGARHRRRHGPRALPPGAGHDGGQRAGGAP